MCMFHNFFIYSSVDQYLGCFYVLATVNSAAMNNGIYVSFVNFVFSKLSFSVSSGYMPKSGTAGSYGDFIPSFLRNLYTVFHSGYMNLHSTKSAKECSLFSTPSPAFIVCRLFDDGHSDPCEVISHCSFDLHFCNNE